MAKSTSYPAPSSYTPPLFSLAVPTGEAAIKWTLALANSALLGCLPERLQTQGLVDRFITPSRIVPVPQRELSAREHADKPSNGIRTFGLLLAAGLPSEQVNELAYSIGPSTRVYANSFLDQPTLFVDEQLYQMFFVPDHGKAGFALGRSRGCG